MSFPRSDLRPDQWNWSIPGRLGRPPNLRSGRFPDCHGAEPRHRVTV